MSYYVTINIASAGTVLAGGDTSSVGHMWYSLENGNGNSSSFGFAPDEDHHGSPFAPGAVYTNDDNNYTTTAYSRTVEISEEQYNTMKSFGENPEDYGFSLRYNGLTNSCIDYTWKALEEGGLNTEGFEGDIWPTFNKDNINRTLDRYEDNSLPSGYSQTTTSDGRNIASTWTDSEGNVVYEESYSYSDDGNTFTLEYTDNETTHIKTYAFDSEGNLITLSDRQVNEDGNSIEYVTDADGTTTKYVTDINGNVLEGEGNNIWQNLKNAGTVAGDAYKLIQAIKTGQPLPVVASGLNLVNDVETFYGSGANATLNGVTSVADGIMSLVGLVAAYQKGDTSAALLAGAQAVNFSATAYANFAGKTASEKYGSAVVQEFGADSAFASLGKALPYLSIVNSLAHGDTESAAVTAIGLLPIPGAQFVPIAYAVYKIIQASNQSIPDPWGSSHFSWKSYGIDAEMGITAFNNSIDQFITQHPNVRINTGYGSLDNAINTLISHQQMPNAGRLLGRDINALNQAINQFVAQHPNTYVQTGITALDNSINSFITHPSLTIQSAGETGGNEAVQNVMNSLLFVMNEMIAEVQEKNPGAALGIIPNRMPSIGYDTSGYRITDIDPLTGGEKHPTLRFDTSGKPYNAEPGSPESFQSILETLSYSALNRGALAPLWEVQTAKLQTDAGDPKAGLTEEERAGRDGQLAAPITGDTQTFRPIVFDLNGNGIETFSRADGVAFNVDDSGYFKQTAWINSDDGFLVLDRNLNGQIDTGSELFSNAVVALSRRGLAGLSWVDANYDGRITVADPVWNELKVWRDLNKNGVQDAGETQTLAQLGITELNYGLGTFKQGSQLKQLASVDLEADKDGVAVQVVKEGILIKSSSDGHVRLITTRIDDLSLLEPNQDGVTAIEDTELLIATTDLLANDSLGGNVAQQSLTISSVQNALALHGTVSLLGKNGLPDGFVHFTPDADYFGNEAGFDYTLSAPTGQTGTGHVVVNVEAVNDAPTIVSVTHNPHIYGTDTGQVIGADVDNPASSLTYTILNQPQYGSASIDAAGNFIYTSWVMPNRPSQPGNDTRYSSFQGFRIPIPIGVEINTDAFQVQVTDPGLDGDITSTKDNASVIETIQVTHDGRYQASTPSGGGGGGGIDIWGTIVDTGEAIGGAIGNALGIGPIAIDLNQNGLSFINLNNSTVFFDVNDDGLKHRISWLNPDDGLLAYDPNGKGEITDASQIAFVGYDAAAKTDLEGLKAFDSNHDGIFSKLDEKWGKFGIWQDVNQNGISEQGEFKTLDQWGVVSIDLTSDQQFSVIDGNTIHGISKVTLTDGTTRDAADVTLAYSNEVKVTHPSGSTSIVSKQNFSPSNEEINGTDGNDLILGNTGNTIIHTYEGNDVVFAGDGNDVIQTGDGNNVIYAAGGNDLVMTGQGDNVVYGGLGNDLILAAGGDNALFGEAGNDIIFSGNGNDLIDGGIGNDVLYGRGGDDILHGNTGNDALFGGAGDDNLLGGKSYDRLQGDVGNDVLDGGEDADELIGGIGDDTYIVDNIEDVVTENANEGIDTIKSTMSYVLAANLENLTLKGIDDINATGNELDNILTGNIGKNILTGQTGNDTYVIHNAGDIIVEKTDEGIDTVKAIINYSLVANVENLILIGKESINGTGNELDNYLTGNAYNNALDGLAGADTMQGGKGDDSYTIDNTGDVVKESESEGQDTVYSSINYTLTDHVEKLVLTGTEAINGTGNTGNNTIMGNSNNNVLDGLAGLDVMQGGKGDDSYTVDNSGDKVEELKDEGQDTVYSSITYTLTDHVEDLVLIGTEAINGTGNALDNRITGNTANNILAGLAGNDTLDGQQGADTMIGGKGNDSYYVDDVGDVVKEHRHSGEDTVYSTITYTLTRHVENLVLIGTEAINGTGNGLDNHLTGNSADNVLEGRDGDDSLDGALGADTLRGGAGDDSYYVDNIGDSVEERRHDGEDTVYSTISYTLTEHVENLVLIGTNAITGKGNALDNHLTGNGLGSILDGQGGDDNYYIDKAGDIIAESADNGWDTVISSIDYTLEDNLEELYLTGTANLNGTGNAQDNNLNGNAGDNNLDGKGGADWMAGREGNDSYIVDNTEDEIEEHVNEGIDTVYASVSYRLTANVENLTLTGTAALNGTGNALDNQITGNNANNILRAGNGNDTLTGGDGSDTLIGERGQDTYDLTETTAATDTLRITKGDSVVNNYDIATHFKLATGNVNTIGVDKLDLDSTAIAANTTGFNGTDSGIIHSHRISDGIISFDDVDSYTDSLAITDTNLADVFSYLQTNITGQKTVAFIADGNTFVFQDAGANDTLVELIGVTASSVNSTGLATNAVWIV